MNASRKLLALAGLLAVAHGAFLVDALAQQRWPRSEARGASAPPPKQVPMLAVVGLREQRITVYDRTGAQMLESPVSSGSTGYETPPGVFSIVQKNVEHHSNLYDDASMPFMQRLTWTGIALHAGELPGYAASHGCVRLPYNFADRLFGLTSVGMRVVVAREAIAPVAIDEPEMFRRDPAVVAAVEAETRRVQLASTRPDGAAADADNFAAHLEARVPPLAAAATAAAARSREMRALASRAKSAVVPAERALRQAESALGKLEADLAAAEKVLAGSAPQKRLDAAQKVKDEAPGRIEAARVARDKARDELKAKQDAARAAEDKADEAAYAHTQAMEVAEKAKLDTSPVSVFISRKTQRLYVRKAFHPIWEAPVLIRDADKPIGTFVLTAHEPAAGTRDLRWSAVSLYRNPTEIEPAQPPPKAAKGKRAAPIETPVTDVAAVKRALARLDIPRDMAARISRIVLPGSSLIISDEPPHLETGKDTDFVVIMSGEPQGGIAIRERAKPERSDDDDDNYYWGGGNNRRNKPYGGGGGGGFFWFN
ncbi:MAG: L,D-transpeptidase family protein [Hyphomicrobiaceae bacterium]|nr:L,D-transpeptidase family protein [Hyphomicrobiaceae bacterium]